MEKNMATNEQFPEIFERLKAILQPYEARLSVEADTAEKYSLMGPYVEKYKKVLWFSMVEMRKSYVSFHLMPVYMFPDLLDDISADLRKRMQGKSCFNFTRIDEMLFEELKGLTERSVERVRSLGMSG
jgi:hypothetical protein